MTSCSVLVPKLAPLALALFLAVPGGLAPSSPPALQEQECQPCTAEQQRAEYDQMIQLYIAAVNTARQDGYQCGSDPGYSDPGLGWHPKGNCADWQQVSWGALVTRTWQCWNVVRIRARRKFIPEHHHFVYIVPKCGGARVYLDPWSSGRPDRFTEDAFPFKNGFFAAWTHYPIERHNAGDAAKNP